MTDAAAAVVTSAYWSSLAAGRMLNTALSAFGLNSWIMISGLLTLSFCSSLLMHMHTESMLWLAAVGLGMGFSAIFPLAYTLPVSYGITLNTWQTARIFLILNGGEAFFPYLAGSLMGAFSPSALEWQISISLFVLLLATFVSWAALTRMTTVV